MMKEIRRWIVGCVAVLLIGESTAQEAAPEDLPRIPFTPVEEALDTFQTRPGIALDLVAHEPLVTDPVSISFDENGNLFAVEMIGYSERREENLGQIRLLFDDDDDGVFERSTVYAKGLKWPTGLVCSRGGVFVVATPDLIWFKDNDGDGVADEKKVVFTGFGEGYNPLNVQGLPNSLQWGPDNRIWGAASTVGGKIRRPDQDKSEAIDIRGRDFSFDPKTLDFRTENGRAQYGLSFDSYGRRYVASNSNHIIAVMWEKPWLPQSGKKWFSMPSPLVSIASDGRAAPVYRISPDEPWRIVRTRWRVAGVVRGVVEGGGRVSGYFTGASGISIYTGDALGPEFLNNAFIGDVGSNLVHRKVVSHDDGRVELVAKRAGDEGKTEFIASTDNWFRPTTYTNAPDGALYISDMYREVIEHPRSLPEGIKKHLDLNSGNDRGRIYRARPADWQRRKTVRLGELSNDDLAGLLDHQNGWHRSTAQRLLWERGDTRAGDGWGSLVTPPAVFSRYRETLALGGSTSADKVEKLASTLSASSGDKWMTAACLSAIETPAEAAGLFVNLSENRATHQATLLQLTEMIGRMNDDTTNQIVLKTLSDFAWDSSLANLVQALGTGLASAKSSIAKADSDGLLSKKFDQARTLALRENASPQERIAAIKLLAFSPGKEANVALETILLKKGNDPFYESVIQVLMDRKHDKLVSVVAENWNHFPDRSHASILSTLTRHPRRAAEVLKAVQSGSIPAEQFSAAQIDLMRQSKDKTVRKLMAELFPVPEPVPRAEVVARYQPVLKSKGDAAAGEKVYLTNCATCHKHGDLGFAVGPDMATFKTAGGDSILTNLFDPNKEIAPQYQAYLFTLNDGGQYLGIIARETSTHVTLRMISGVEKRFPRSDVQSMKALGKSLMPEGLENTLSQQNVADLLAFIAGL